MNDNFVHLHVHSEYSLLDGLSSVRAIAAHAAVLGQQAVALTDHGVMSGAIEFYDACKKQNVEPIIGMEAYLARRGRRDRDPHLDGDAWHLLLLAETLEGYKNLMRLATAAQLEGFYRYPRVDKEILEAHSAGLVCTSGCLSAEIPDLLRVGRENEALAALEWYHQIFAERFYLELQQHQGLHELDGINRQLIEWSKQFDIPLVATCDAHYLRAEDAEAHDLLLCVQTGKTLDDPKRMRMSARDYYLRSAAEMTALWSDVPNALTNTLEIAERCNLDLSFDGYRLPRFAVPEETRDFASQHTPESYLRALSEEGLARRYQPVSTVVRQRMEYELGVIHTMGFDTYFLIVWDLVRHAREEGIWFNVRGSAASSIVAYALGITSIEPLGNHLIFERFLNPDRVSMPDIDLDFADDERGRMLEYAVAKYGQENVAQIISFGRMLAKAAVRDVGRVLGYPIPEVDRIAKLIPAAPGQTLADALVQSANLKSFYENDVRARTLIDQARALEGVARNVSTHPAGVIIADKPIVEYAPLHRATKVPTLSGARQRAQSKGDENDVPVTQYAMNDLERIGLLKIDFLGLATLRLMREVCEMVRSRHGVSLDLSNIPIDDPEAFALLARGEVLGIFQVESEGLKKVLVEMKPTHFEHIVAAIALYRPGPLQYIPTYIARMHGKESVTYLHPSLEPIFGETYGICVSGDAIVTDVQTGRRLRLDEVGSRQDICLQGIDGEWKTAVGRVTRWIHNGRRPVWELQLRNGAQIKVTADHQLLTESGWRPLSELQVGDHVGTPTGLISQNETFDRRNLRVLAYLLAEGDLGNRLAVNFTAKDARLLDEYEKCLAAFENTSSHRLTQIHGVTRISTAKSDRTHYHAPSGLLAWLRELGLKHPPGFHPGGARSPEKFIPQFVFSLRQEDIAYFLASLWDCDGTMAKRAWSYKTISRQFAGDVQTLLLKLGLPSATYISTYKSKRGPRTAYQVTVFDTTRFAQWITPHLITAKRLVKGTSRAGTSIERAPFLTELVAATNLSQRALEARFGMSCQHFSPTGRARKRIRIDVVRSIASQLNLTETLRKCRIRWEQVISIKPAGEEDVYDLTVEGLHNFVANNIIVHNCVYQEQVMRIARDCCGFTGSEADALRKAVGKKNKQGLLAQRDKFVRGAMQHAGMSNEIANKLFDDIEFFARYAFNRAHAANYAALTCQTAYLKAHYPLEYQWAMCNNEAGDFEKIPQLATEARRVGIQVLPPDVRASDVCFTIEYDRRAIRYGLGAIKNVGASAAREIVDAQRQGGTFASLDDFCQRVSLKQINRRALECLIEAGALDALGERAAMLKSIDRLIGASVSAVATRDNGQMSLFGGVVQEFASVEMAKVQPMTDTAKADCERELLGVAFSENLVERLRLAKREHAVPILSSMALADRNEKSGLVKTAGVIKNIRTTKTKTKGETMAFVQIEDEEGDLELVLFPRAYANYVGLLHKRMAVLVEGRVQNREDKISFLVERMNRFFKDDDSDKEVAERPFVQPLSRHL